jgi:hypothetical protein
MHRIAERPEPATAKRHSFDDHGAHSGTGFARVPGKCIARVGALAASTCERDRAHHRRICLVANGAGSAASRVCQRGAIWLRIVIHRAEIRYARQIARLNADLLRRRYVPLHKSLDCGNRRCAFLAAVATRSFTTQMRAGNEPSAGHRLIIAQNRPPSRCPRARRHDPRLWQGGHIDTYLAGSRCLAH